MLPPSADNPWQLPVTESAALWGVTPAAAVKNSTSAARLLAPTSPLALRVVGLNTVPLELYEDELRQLARMGSMVGIGFDASLLAQNAGAAAASLHVLRLTPLPHEAPASATTVNAPGYGFGYRGDITVFDDSRRGGALAMPWRRLLDVALASDGALWVVGPLASA